MTRMSFLVACALLAVAPPVATSQTRADAREDSTGIEARRSAPVEPGAASFAQTRPALSARERRRLDKDARRRARLLHYTHAAAAVDAAANTPKGDPCAARRRAGYQVRQGGLPLSRWERVGVRAGDREGCANVNVARGPVLQRSLQLFLWRVL